jgi:ABC-type cobalamin/Fe3+-siderophores transport system ATPase subunit
MNLLLQINIEKKTTMIMVTHNPDVECYADRLLYIKDGVFVKQAFNSVQTRLVFDDYTGTLSTMCINSLQNTCANKTDDIRRIKDLFSKFWL